MLEIKYETLLDLFQLSEKFYHLSGGVLTGRFPRRVKVLKNQILCVYNCLMSSNKFYIFKW